jgi:hypothetical protein
VKKRAKKAKPLRAKRVSARGTTRSQIAKAAAESFVKGVLTRGEAAKAVKGKLPPGVTHEIVGTGVAGLPTIKRRRFSLA